MKKNPNFILYPDGRSKDVKPAGARWTLAELQGLVGGYIETLFVDRVVRVGATYSAMDCTIRKLFVFDEEGRLKRLPLNNTASVLANRELVGPVVVVDPEDLD